MTIGRISGKVRSCHVSPLKLLARSRIRGGGLASGSPASARFISASRHDFRIAFKPLEKICSLSGFVHLVVMVPVDLSFHASNHLQ